jgi:hypothetical protein
MYSAGTLDLTGAFTPPIDPTAVVGLGVQIFSGDVCPYANPGVPVVFNLDTVTD